MKKSAFTLIELLVVIAIISLLAALAIPQIAKALESGKSASDSNNLHSLGQIFFKYLTDHDDEMPTLGSGTVWPDQLHKAGADYKVFKSPFDRRPAVDGTNAPVSYGVNQSTFGLSTSDFLSPSSLIIMGDAATPGPHGALVFGGNATQNVAITSGTNTGVYRGGTYLNVLYADWHVAPISKPNFADTSTNEGKKRWDPVYDENGS